jgi:hypothetical protein
MEEKEAKKIQKLADFYSELLDIEKAFESAKKEIETKFSIANNFDLENPETYIKLIRPVSRQIQHIGNTCKLAKYRLREYRELDSKISQKSSKPSKQVTTTTKSHLTLEQRVSRLEFIVYLLLAFLIGMLAKSITEIFLT